MSNRKLCIAANWKMNPVPAGALDADSPYRKTDAVEVAVFPTFVDLQACVEAGLPTGAQYGRAEAGGAFTGDVSLQMVKDVGCEYVLCGHSERRQYHGETDDMVAEQASTALELGLKPIICVGETLDEREAGKAEEVVSRQIQVVLDRMTNDELRITIAYEPVWAIGTGKTATPEQAQEMHAFLRSLCPVSSVLILYGGSMKPENAAALLSQPDIDGGLIGGASLQKESFAAIVDIAKSLA